ncbi:hypothetical protein DVH24_005650 [Malus domestica]|uniref:Retrotransposon gag domain-containing protein n=1 Tax=Malus domestica TaxID=3750 RepID=A0A498IMX9_MALDO|nr:hypothetical protein DVH24_005650 [Malus domestica]
MAAYGQGIAVRARPRTYHRAFQCSESHGALRLCKFLVMTPLLQFILVCNNCMIIISIMHGTTLLCAYCCVKLLSALAIKRREFLALKQGEMSVVDYDWEFWRLVEYCPGIRDNAKEKKNCALIQWVNDGVTYETLSAQVKGLSKLITGKMKGKQASTDEGQFNGFKNKFKVENINEALFMGGMKCKVVFFKRKVSLLLLAVGVIPLHDRPIRVLLVVVDFRISYRMTQQPDYEVPNNQYQQFALYLAFGYQFFPPIHQFPQIDMP